MALNAKVFLLSCFPYISTFVLWFFVVYEALVFWKLQLGEAHAAVSLVNAGLYFG